ncbi:Serine hydroxymethyltransferase (EC [Olavius sp. associated proteobacterium Delta 1]|nr:Serine hydroxymethyltransferase (EC [Olavius sp. associated proteobacterium Delta 1]
MNLENTDPEIYSLMEKEILRQQETINLIASENYVSRSVLEATASVLTNKYSEGYPQQRYYQGNEIVDATEIIAIERAKKLFGAEHANVQPYSGSPANAAVYMAFLNPGDTFIGFDLSCGGHLTHGHPVNFSGKTYRAVNYSVDKTTEKIDMDEVRRLALEHGPKMIISGLTAYPRQIDFSAFQKIADEIGAIHFADISHISGLIIGSVHPSPFPFCDVAMTTTHKTLRGPRGAIILCQKKYAKQIDRAVFPGSQGGPHDHITAAKAVALKEALSPDFKRYAETILANAKALADELTGRKIKLVTGGTDNHMVLINLLPLGIGLGRPAAVALENAGIVTNANTVPFDPSTPFKPSGIRIGTPAVTTRGMRDSEMAKIGRWIAAIVTDQNNLKLQAGIKDEVGQLCREFPITKYIFPPGRPSA